MPRAITILTDNFADWETALFNATARLYYGFDTSFATPDGKPVTSSAGMLVTPQQAIHDIDLRELDVLLLCGGSAWQDARCAGLIDSLLPILQAAHERGVVLAGICDGTRVLAQAGLLNHVRHTSNSADNLAVPGYAGAALYQQVPHAVADGKIVTAPGTAPVSLARATLGALGIADPELHAYLQLHAAEHADG